MLFIGIGLPWVSNEYMVTFCPSILCMGFFLTGNERTRAKRSFARRVLSLAFSPRCAFGGFRVFEKTPSVRVFENTIRPRAHEALRVQLCIGAFLHWGTSPMERGGSLYSNTTVRLCVCHRVRSVIVGRSAIDSTADTLGEPREHYLIYSRLPHTSADYFAWFSCNCLLVL